MARLKQFYTDSVVPALMQQFGYSNPMEIPRITKITLNMGVGEAVADRKVMEHAVGDMTKIAGQKPIVINARKSVAGFKVLITTSIHDERSAVTGRRRKTFNSVSARFVAPVHGIVRRGWRAATRRKRDDLMPAFTLAFADILRDPMDVVIELRSETPLDGKDFIVWIRNHLRSP